MRLRKLCTSCFEKARCQLRSARCLALAAEGISLTMSYPPVHQLEVFRDPSGFAPRWRDRTGMQDWAALSLPVTERLAETTLWFTTSVLMGTKDDALDVARAVEKVQRNARALS